MSEVNIFGVPWEEIVNWYLAQPIYGQILVLVGLFALLALAVVIVYYVLKGVAYLVYYVIKGVYYLLKGIGLLFYKLFEGLYYAISGKPKKKEETIPQTPQPSTIPPEQISNLIRQNEIRIPTYCTECGQKITESMGSLLSSRGVAFCFYCGKEFEIRAAEQPNF